MRHLMCLLTESCTRPVSAHVYLLWWKNKTEKHQNPHVFIIEYYSSLQAFDMITVLYMTLPCPTQG